MNAATVERSNRLKRLWAVLRDRKPHSTRDLVRRAHICAVNSAISELRCNGLNIACQRKGGTWFYRLSQ